MHIRLIATEAELRLAWPVMVQLRPHLDETAFVAQCQIQRQEGFCLAALHDEAGTIRALAGFRIHQKLVSGKTLYVDDLVSDETGRSRGYGAALIAWLQAHGREQGCALLSLDSGVQRYGAHRFYLRERFDITCHHFTQAL